MKKLFAVLLAMLLILSALPIAVMAEGNTTTVPTTSWEDNGNYDDTWYTGHENDTTYEIDSAKKLAGLLTLSRSYNFRDKTVYITADIDLGAHNWSTIGAEEMQFEGTIEGKKGGVEGAAVTISNLISVYPSRARAGFLSRHACGGVKNLTFDNAYVKGTRYSAVISGDVRLGVATNTYVAENLTVKNSRVEIGADAIYSDVAGLLFGAINPFGAELTMKKLSAVNSTASGRTMIGALIGRTTWGTLNIEDSVVADCTVTVSDGYAGGFCSWTDMNKMTFSNCYASGFVAVESKDTFGSAGFLGHINAKKHTLSFTDCQNDMFIKSGTSRVGAFLGEAISTATSLSVALNNCVSTGVGKGLNGFEWIATDVAVLAVTAENCYSILTTKLSDTVSTQSMTAGTELTGLDYTSKWKNRTDMYPVLAIAENYAKNTYAKADLSWFTPTVADAKYNLTTETQVLGLGMLSRVCSPMEFDIAVDETLRSKLNEEGLMDPDFLAAYDPVGTSAPKSEGIDGVRSENENWKTNADLTLNRMSLFVNDPTVWTSTNGTKVKIFVEVPVAEDFQILSLNLIVNVDPESCTTGMNDANGFGKIVSATFSGEGKAVSMTWNGGVYGVSDSLGLSSSDYIVKIEEGKWILEVQYTLPEKAQTALTNGSYEIAVDAAVAYTNGQVNFNSKTNMGGFDEIGTSATKVMLSVNPPVGGGDTTNPGGDDMGTLPPNETTAPTDDTTVNTQNSNESKGGCKSTVNAMAIVVIMLCTATFLTVNSKKRQADRT